MRLVISLEPEVERVLTARAAAEGVSVEAYAVRVLEREAVAPARVGGSGRELVLLCAQVRGLADDLDLRRESGGECDRDLG